eukprot:763901-Hanusia_phi.AAC.3
MQVPAFRPLSALLPLLPDTRQACNVIIAGPESIVPKGPDMQRPRMQTLLREGLQAERKETVKDLFSHMFGYTVNDVKTSAAD